MKNWKKFALCAACLATLAFTVPDIAEAARMGGGRSFGSSSVMKRSVTPPAGTYGSSTMSRQAAPMQSSRMDGGAATMTRNNTGLFGGLFGGLLAGTMLGSLFGGHAAAGTAGGAGMFMNLLLIGLLVYFGVRLFRRMSGRNSARQEDYQARQEYSTPGSSAGQSGAWDTLRSAQPAAQASASASLPADFDQEEFLRGAKAAYTRMQASWDRRDLDDIAQFATESVMEELRRQAQEDPQPSKTELLLVTASVLDVWDEEDKRRVAVSFDVLMREDQNVQQPVQVREVWYFVCSNKAGDSWKLDGIQQFSR